MSLSKIAWTSSWILPSHQISTLTYIRRTRNARERNAHLVKPIYYSRNTKTKYCSWRTYIMLAFILPSDQLSGLILNTRRIHNPKKMNAHLIKTSCYYRNTMARCCS